MSAPSSAPAERLRNLARNAERLSDAAGDDRIGAFAQALQAQLYRGAVALIAPPPGLDADAWSKMIVREYEQFTAAVAAGEHEVAQRTTETIAEQVNTLAELAGGPVDTLELLKTVRQLETRLAGLEPLVRRDAEERVAIELEKAHVAQAILHRRAWNAAQVGMFGSLVGAGIAAVVVHVTLRPASDASAADAVSAAALSFFILGLALYVVRIFAQAYRAQRHLEIVNTQKADALRTFNEMIGMQREPEVQAAIATALAGFIFASEGSGFLNDSAEHVTLVERSVAGLAPRAAPQ